MYNAIPESVLCGRGHSSLIRGHINSEHTSLIPIRLIKWRYRRNCTKTCTQN